MSPLHESQSFSQGLRNDNCSMFRKRNDNGRSSSRVINGGHRFGDHGKRVKVCGLSTAGRYQAPPQDVPQE